MSATEALRAVAGGERPANGALLQNCRMEAFGADFYGEEAILEACRAQPCELAATDALTCPTQVALFDGDLALFADVYGDNLGRIWRVGKGRRVEPEPALAVPFDPDLSQARGDVQLRAEDHAFLPGVAAELLRAWVRVELGGIADEGGLRTRAFLLRAFADGDEGAALFAVHHLGPGPVRTAHLHYVAARFRLGEDDLSGARLIVDMAGLAAAREAPWRPRL